jgi:hypothetical protein
MSRRPLMLWVLPLAVPRMDWRAADMQRVMPRQDSRRDGDFKRANAAKPPGVAPCQTNTAKSLQERGSTRMYAITVFRSAKQLMTRLRKLRERRRQGVAGHASRAPRTQLTARDRQVVLAKTGSRCHICGGRIRTHERWCADHVFGHANGGTCEVDNFLPAHAICNNYRWHYGPEELQWILKLGVWFRSRIEKDDPLAMQLAERFVLYDARRNARRVSP